MASIRRTGSKIKVKTPKSGSERLELVLDNNHVDNYYGHQHQYHQPQPVAVDDSRGDYSSYYNNQDGYREEQHDGNNAQQYYTNNVDEPQYYNDYYNPNDGLIYQVPSTSSHSASTTETDNRAMSRQYTSSELDSINQTWSLGSEMSGVDIGAMVEDARTSKVQFNMESIDESGGGRAANNRFRQQQHQQQLNQQSQQQKPDISPRQAARMSAAARYDSFDHSEVDQNNAANAAYHFGYDDNDDEHDEYDIGLTSTNTFEAADQENDDDDDESVSLGSFVSEAVSEAGSSPVEKLKEEHRNKIRQQQQQQQYQHDENSDDSQADLVSEACKSEAGKSEAGKSCDTSVESVGWKVITTFKKGLSKKKPQTLPTVPEPESQIESEPEPEEPKVQENRKEVVNKPKPLPSQKPPLPPRLPPAQPSPQPTKQDVRPKSQPATQPKPQKPAPEPQQRPSSPSTASVKGVLKKPRYGLLKIKPNMSVSANEAVASPSSGSGQASQALGSSPNQASAVNRSSSPNDHSNSPPPTKNPPQNTIKAKMMKKNVIQNANQLPFNHPRTNKKTLVHQDSTASENNRSRAPSMSSAETSGCSIATEHDDSNYDLSSRGDASNAWKQQQQMQQQQTQQLQQNELQQQVNDAISSPEDDNIYEEDDGNNSAVRQGASPRAAHRPHPQRSVSTITRHPSYIRTASNGVSAQSVVSELSNAVDSTYSGVQAGSRGAAVRSVVSGRSDAAINEDDEGNYAYETEDDEEENYEVEYYDPDEGNNYYESEGENDYYDSDAENYYAGQQQQQNGQAYYDTEDEDNYYQDEDNEEVAEIYYDQHGLPRQRPKPPSNKRQQQAPRQRRQLQAMQQGQKQQHQRQLRMQQQLARQRAQQQQQGRILQEQQSPHNSQQQPQKFFHHRRTLPQDHPSRQQQQQGKPTLQRTNSNVTDISATSSAISAKSNAALDGYVSPEAPKDKKSGGGGFLKKKGGLGWQKKAKTMKGFKGFVGKNKKQQEQPSSANAVDAKNAKQDVDGDGGEAKKGKGLKKKRAFLRRKSSSGGKKDEAKDGEVEEENEKEILHGRMAQTPTPHRPSTPTDARTTQARQQQQQNQRPEPISPSSPFTTQYQFEGYDHLKSPRAPSPPQPQTYDHVTNSNGNSINPSWLQPDRGQQQQPTERKMDGNVNNENIAAYNNFKNASDSNPWANIPSPMRPTNVNTPQSQHGPANLFTNNGDNGPPPDGQVNLQGSGMPAFKWWTWKQSSSSLNETDPQKQQQQQPGQKQGQEGEDEATYLAFLCMFPNAAAAK